MQTSGTFPQLSDGVKKTVTTCVPAPPAAAKIPAPKSLATPKPQPASANTHRRGGFAKHAKVGK